ncbi:MAG TPA: CHAT domain-containing tetratricopeptide repeat protein, partial [Myxococcaceae bacterium]|nr:CHAT domain-containing tetratricopeptide repeat protein [Myxococcaceae bacterium]
SDASLRLKEARALVDKGLDREARQLYEALLPELRAQRNEIGLAEALNSLSVIARGQGEHQLAIAWAREAADLFRKLANPKGEAQALNNQGSGEVNRADYSAARTHFKSALTLYQGIKDREGEIEEFNNIGSVSYYQGWYLNALEAYQAAMALVEGAAAEPWSPRRRLITKFNLATLFQRLGRDDKALELYRQVLKAPGALRPSEEAQLYRNLGVMYRHLGDPVKALETFRQAQEVFHRQGRKDGQISVLINAGVALALDLDDVPSALESFTSALTLSEQTQGGRAAMQAHLYRGESFLRLNRVDSAKEEFDNALAAARQLGTSEEEWKALYGLGRTAERTGQTERAAGYFRQAIDRIESIRSSLQLSLLKEEFLGDKRDVYDSLIELSLNNPDVAELFNLMERSRARAFQDRLQESAGRTSASPRTVKLDEARSRLDGSTLLLELWAGPKSTAVVWVTREGSGIISYRLSPADLDEISDLVRELSNSSGEGWKNYSQHLGKLLLSGIEPLSRPGLQHLLIVPDGVLMSVPFEVLEAGADRRLLVERFDVSYLPTVSALWRTAPASGGRWLVPWGRRLVAFGDPIVSSRLGPNLADVFPEEELRERLPASAQEVQAIALMSGGRSEIHLGADDLKKYLMQGNAKGVPLLHLSSHATADLASPERSRILFSSGNKDGRPDYLFLRELYDLDLRGVELVTLSACDTERGKILRAEGVQGFSRALLSAGSLAAVTTLWRVADQPTSELMKQFYYAIGQGRTKAQALRLAKLKFLQSGSDLAHPRHWAAFVLNGDGLRPVTKAFPWSIVLAPIASALLLVGLAAHWRIRASRGRPE